MAKRNFVGAKGARLLRRVARHILAEPLRYDQNSIIEVGEPKTIYRDERKFPACGTVACIGGWIEILSRKHPNRAKLSLTGLSFKKIAKLLGTGEDNVGALTQYTSRNPSNSDTYWPLEFSEAYGNAKTPLQKARIANQRIEHFIRTGE